MGDEGGRSRGVLAGCLGEVAGFEGRLSGFIRQGIGVRRQGLGQGSRLGATVFLVSGEWTESWLYLSGVHF